MKYSYYNTVFSGSEGGRKWLSICEDCEVEVKILIRDIDVILFLSSLYRSLRNAPISAF